MIDPLPRREAGRLWKMIEVRFAPVEGSDKSGVVSFQSWNNQQLIDAIVRSFSTSPREQVYRIDIERDGIKAYFKPRNA
jgi:hypothetical protein